MALSAVRLAEALAQAPTMTLVSWWGISGVVCALARTLGLVSVARLDAKLGSEVGLALRAEITASLLQRGRGSEDAGAGRVPEGVAPLAGPVLVGTLVLAVRAVEGAAVSGVLGTMRAWLLLSPLVIALVVWLPPAVLVTALAFVPFALVLARVRGRVRAAEREALRRAAALDAHLDDLLRNIDLFRVHGTRNEVFLAMERLGQGSAEAGARAAGARAFASAMNEIVAAVAVGAFALAITAGIVSIDPRRAAPALAIAFLLYRPLRDLGDARASHAAGRAALDVLEPHRASGEAASLPARAGAGTASAPRPPAFANSPSVDVAAFGAAAFGPRWTFRAAAGTITAIVGPVGVGKTTLFRALLGLERSEGSARVDERRVDDRPVDERPFAWVPQDVALVAGDLRHNLALGGSHVEEAVELLGALAPSLSASLGRGEGLSGGERALLAIARAVASGRPVLLLDEPSAHLDAMAETRVAELLGKLRASRTLLVITHRPALVTLADQTIEAPVEARI